MSASLVWFRNDLRLADNPALIAAWAPARPVVPVYVLDEETDGIRPLGAASRWWLHHSLQALDASLRALGSRLILRRGPAEQVIERPRHRVRRHRPSTGTAPTTKARASATTRLQAGLNPTRRGPPEGLKGNLLFEPWDVKTTAGEVVQGLHRLLARLPRLAVARRAPARPQDAAGAHALAFERVGSRRGSCCRARPTGRAACGRPGRPAKRRPRRGSRNSSTRRSFATARNATCRRSKRPRACRRISPSARSARGRSGAPPRCAGMSAATEKFLAELGWREFAYHLLFHLGDLAQRNFRPEFDAFPWEDDERCGRGLAARPHRLSDRRRRHARIVDDRLDAQSRAHDRRRRS